MTSRDELGERNTALAEVEERTYDFLGWTADRNHQHQLVREAEVERMVDALSLTMGLASGPVHAAPSAAHSQENRLPERPRHGSVRRRVGIEPAVSATAGR